MKEAIWVLYGIVYFIGFKECSIESNGYNITTTNGQFPGRHYGLIKYECGNVNGFLISQMNCQKCWIYCPDNELIEGCKQQLLPLIMGLLLGILLTIVTYISYVKCINPKIIKILNAAKDKSMQKKIKKQERKLDIIRTEIEMHHMSRNPINKNLYPSLSVTLLMLFMILSITSACDNTLFVTSTGMVCDNNKCIKSEMYDLSLETGTIICFRDSNSELMTIKMKKAYLVHKSSLVYYTSSFQTSTTSIWACKGKDLCWNGMCHDGSVHPSFKNNNNESLKAVKYGCDSDTLGCDTACFYQTSCTYYKLTVLPEGQYYPIFKLVSSMWAVDLEVTHKNISKVYKLNVNNPRFNLDTLDISNIPIIVTGLSYQIDHIEKFYMFVNNDYLNIDAAEINMPERDKIGDIQISTDKKTMSYNIDDIKCRAISCKVRCKSQEPRILRVIKNTNRYITHPGHFVENINTLVTRQSINGIAKVMIGNVNLNSLRVTLAKCHLDLVGTFSCSGCALKPYAIIQASEIKEQGLLPFESNCSFSENYLSCNEEPYTLEVVSQSKYCKLYIPSSNLTINIVFEYNFLGKLDPSKEMYSMSESYENYTDMLKNRTIWETLGYSWLGFSILSLLVSLIIRNFSGIAGFLTAVVVTKKVEESVDSGTP